MSDRMRGRPCEISRVSVQLGDQQMTLSVRNGRTVAEICRAVRGVVLSRQTVPIQEWAAALAGALVAYAEQNAQAAQALRRLVAGSLATRIGAGPGTSRGIRLEAAGIAARRGAKERRGTREHGGAPLRQGDRGNSGLRGGSSAP